MTRAYALALALLDSGHGVEIIGMKLTPGPVYPTPPENLTVTEITGCCAVQRVWRLLARLDGDILYAIKPRPGSYGVALIKRAMRSRPVVLDIDDWEQGLMDSHAGSSASLRRFRPNLLNRLTLLTTGAARDLTISRVRGLVKTRLIMWLDRAVQRADAVTVNTRFLHDRYGGWYVPHCRDVHKFDPARFDPGQSRARYGLDGYIVLMFPGTPREHKGLEDLLAALDQLGNPAVRLVLVGGRRSCDAYVARLVAHRRKWILRLPTFSAERMPDVIAAAHIIVIPQRNTDVACAQFPMKLTDAMAMAKPVLSTTVGDIPEILDGTGFLVQPSDPRALADMLAHMLQNPDLLSRRGAAARKRFKEAFSLGVIGPRLSAIMAGLS